MVKKTVHEKLNKNKLKNIESNAAKFASIINSNRELTEKKTFAGINLDLNRFSELEDTENIGGRFWDLNSNANASANIKANTSSNVKSKITKGTKKIYPNLVPSYFLKATKTNFKSTNSRQIKRVDSRYDPKKDRQNVAFPNHSNHATIKVPVTLW